MSIESDLRDAQRRHGAIKKIMAGELTLGNTSKYATLEKEFTRLTDLVRKLEKEYEEEQRKPKEPPKKVEVKTSEKPTDPTATYERLMANVRDIDSALADVKATISKEKDSAKQAELRREENKLKQLWQKVVMAARDARKK